MIDRVQGAAAVQQPRQQNAQGAPPAADFGRLMHQVQGEAARDQAPEEPSGERSVESVINFSKHAMSRAEERGIEVTDTLMDQLADSVERASAKGATNILAFDATRAFIINIPHGRVITTMSQEEMQENIFTNIDGAVLLK